MTTIPMYVSIPGAGVLAVLGLAYYFWMEHPGFVLYHLTKIAYWRVGLKKRNVKAKKYNYSYLERGRPKTGSPSLLMVHGFSANKDMYLAVAQKLPRDIHLVMVDLIGHGETDLPDDKEDISLIGLSRCLKEFVDAAGLSRAPFHLLGTSLGGAISAAYAACYPSDIERVTLCCPAMLTPTTTLFQDEVRAGKCRLLPTDLAGVEVMLLLCMFNHDKVPVSKQVMKGLLQQRLPRQHFYERLFQVISKCMHEEQAFFLEQVANISAPSQVIWGKQDELLHVSGAKVLQSKLKNCLQVDILDKCGHIISMDRPFHMTKAILEFRGGAKSKRV